MYSEDIRAVAAFIKALDPDIAFVQELIKDYPNDGTDSGEYLARELGYNRFFDYGPMSLPTGESAVMGMGIFSKLPLTHRQKVILQPSRITNGVVEQDERFFLQAAVATPKGLLGLGTTHLPFHPTFRTTPLKNTMTNTIIESALTYKNYILGADLNTTPFTKAAKNFRQQGFTNAGPSLKQPTWTTKPFSINDWHYDALNWRLDYLLVKGAIATKSAKIITTDLSDHSPIVGELQLTKFKRIL